MSSAAPTQSPSAVWLLRRLAAYLQPHWRWQVAAVMSTVVLVAATLPFPWLTKILIDDIVGAGNLDLLGLVAAGIVAAAVAQTVFSLASDFLFTTAGEQAINDLRTRLMNHTLRLPLAYFRRQRTGDVVAHFTTDSVAVTGVYRSAFGAAPAAAIELAVMLLVVGIIDWRFVLVSIGVIPLQATLPALLGRPQRRAGEREQSAMAALGGLSTELVAGAREIKAFNRQGWAARRLASDLRQLFSARLRAAALRHTRLFFNVIHELIRVAIFALLAGAILGGEVEFGVVFALALYMQYLARPGFVLMSAYAETQHALGAAGRLFTFLDTPAEPVRRDADRRLPVIRGEIAFERVSAAYESGAPVIHDVSFTAPARRTTALVGPSGSGKTTIANLLLRFLQPGGGRIVVDGRDVGTAAAAELRRHVGVVFQDPVLFAGTVADNIRFGRDDISESRIVEAATIANAHDFISAMPQGYATQIGERGLRLSGGQAQRIAIARAIAADPRVLVLDEATSALDAEAERLVHTALERAAEDRTVLVIAHRLATVRGADRIVVLDAGRVVDTGRHDELYERCDLYRELCDLQMTSTGAVSQ
ncbi:MAG: ABC transporter ATP-binding protein [Acidobacteria bacterium]|nr:ABC transporter ATP-binding protein [Acidobacteriota bacterium]